MMELTIDEKVYSFSFGMGFMREINKQVAASVDGVPGVKKSIGLQYMVAGLMDGDVEALVEILDTANKTQSPRITRKQLDAYIDQEDTDMDKLFAQVLDFLGSANATRKTVKNLTDALEQRKAAK